METDATIDRLTTRTLADVSTEVALDAFAASFAGYQVPISLTPAQFDARFRSENVDAFASHLFFDAAEAVAIVAIARRGWTSRVAAMGIVPRLRGCGLGLAIMRRAVADARARGDVGLVLEAIESNVRAVKLYGRAGFEIVRPLPGFSIDAGRAGSSSDALHEIDPASGARHAGGFATPDLPWQLQVPSLAAMVRPVRCFTNAAASIVAFVDPGHAPIRLRALAFVPDLAAGDAAAFTTSLQALFPDRPLIAPPIFTEAHHARFFGPGGWKASELRQLEMRHPLEVSPSMRRLDAK